MSERTEGAREPLLTPPPPGICWSFARPDILVQCCWCGEPIMPGDYAMVYAEETGTWWSHYDSRPCYGEKPR